MTRRGAADASSLTAETWECTGAVNTADGRTYELGDALNASVMTIHFFGEDEVRVYADTNFTIMKWELNGSDLVFSGDDTYYLTVEGDGAKLGWDNFQDMGLNLESEQVAE